MISNLANVSPKAKVGNNVKIDAFATVYEGVEIGDNTWIGPNAVIFPDTIIGHDCKIFPGACIGPVSQDLKYRGEPANTVVGNNTVIREYVTIHKGTADRMTTKVGDNCLLMAYVHIAHDCIIGNNVIMASYAGLSGHITIEDYAILEGNVGAQQFTTVGAHAFVAGSGQIRKSVPPYIRVAREPLQYIGVNTVGLTRRGFAKEKIQEIENIYRTIFVHNNSITKALDIVEAEMPETEVRNQIINFIRGCKDGVVKGV